MNYLLDINTVPFEAIKSGKKKIETRTFVEEYESPDYRKMKKGDMITFENNQTREKFIVEVLGVWHYPDVASLFDAKGQEKCMSYDAPRNDAIGSYNELPDMQKVFKSMASMQ